MEDGSDAAEVVRRIRALFTAAETRKIALDLNELISEVLRLTHEEASRKSVVVERDLQPALPPVWGDRLQVQQVVLNLLMNGIDATDLVSDRPRRLSVRSGSRRVERHSG